MYFVNFDKLSNLLTRNEPPLLPFNYLVFKTVY